MGLGLKGLSACGLGLPGSLHLCAFCGSCTGLLKQFNVLRSPSQGPKQLGSETQQSEGQLITLNSDLAESTHVKTRWRREQNESPALDPACMPWMHKPTFFKHQKISILAQGQTPETLQSKSNYKSYTPRRHVFKDNKTP